MSFNYVSYLQNFLKEIKQENRYRTFVEIKRQSGNFPIATYTGPDGSKKDVIVWCSNDYLGMGQHPIVANAAIEAIEQSGTGAGGTRNISGTSSYHVALERSVADLHNKEAGLVFSSGYVANEATLSALGQLLPAPAFFSDSLNHASMIHGIKSSRAEKFIFRHNDLDHLRFLLKSQDHDRPKIIAFESVYSMDGDIGYIEEFVSIAKQFNALTYLDEVHAVGLYGSRGGGVAEELGAMEEIDIIQGTFGKAYGSMGGFITANRDIIDAIRSFANGFIFTTSLPPPVLNASLASVEYLKQSNKERKILHSNTAFLKEKIKERKLKFYEHESHIVPIIIGDAKCAQELSKVLLNHYDIYIQPINFPTVPRGTERLRIVASAAHSKEQIESLANILYELKQQHSFFTENGNVA